jgi:hypothetical protein
MKLNYEKRMRLALGELNMYNPHGLRENQKKEEEEKNRQVNRYSAIEEKNNQY